MADKFFVERALLDAMGCANSSTEFGGRVGHFLFESVGQGACCLTVDSRRDALRIEATIIQTADRLAIMESAVNARVLNNPAEWSTFPGVKTPPFKEAGVVPEISSSLRTAIARMGDFIKPDESDTRHSQVRDGWLGVYVLLSKDLGVTVVERRVNDSMPTHWAIIKSVRELAQCSFHKQPLRAYLDTVLRFDR